MALFTGFTADTGNTQMDELLTRGGMQSMLDTVWLILSAMMFGGVMEKSGMLQTIANNILSYAKEHWESGNFNFGYQHRDEYRGLGSVHRDRSSGTNVPCRVQEERLTLEEPFPLPRRRRDH